VTRRAKDSDVLAGEAKHESSIADALSLRSPTGAKHCCCERANFHLAGSAVQRAGNLSRGIFARFTYPSQGLHRQRMLREPRLIVAVNRRN
jgi:hypothetical protein